MLSSSIFFVIQEDSSKVALSPGDPNSYSRPDQVTTTHIHMEWDIDFENKIVSGKCTYEFDKIDLGGMVSYLIFKSSGYAPRGGERGEVDPPPTLILVLKRKVKINWGGGSFSDGWFPFGGWWTVVPSLKISINL